MFFMAKNYLFVFECNKLNNFFVISEEIINIKMKIKIPNAIKKNFNIEK